MDMPLIASLVTFVVIMSVTPGPNNIMMMSSSALFGVRATLPHWLGVNFGFNLLLIASVFGLGELIGRFPVMLDVVRIGGSLWLVWMAWKFAHAGWAIGKAGSRAATAREDRSRPFRSWEAALFQAINPKAILMAVSTAGAYVALADTPMERVGIFVTAFILFGAPCGLLWIFVGGGLKRLLAEGASARWLNYAIAGILMFTIWLILSA
ncbi:MULTISPECIES: LysE family translocator [Maricaulis]|uniref:LysE family translocator n=1 Tax=Maricaulis TaxID=74317 RepID=UPI000C66BF67|nr:MULTISPECIES: LysE family translocator [Maricaulis]MAC88472.1 hypothetical protein [Maricaulis sp.]